MIVDPFFAGVFCTLSVEAMVVIVVAVVSIWRNK